MKKKNSVILCLLFSVFLASCGGNNHIAKSEWTFDDTQHWHECDTKGHDDKLDVANHTWNDGLVTTQPTEEAQGEKTFACTVCGATKTQPIEKLPHVHTFDMANWEKDDTNHWHECDCGEKVEIEAHTYGDYSEKTPAGIDQDKQYSRKCTECQYEDVLTFDNTKTNGTYCVAITQVINANSEKILQVQVFRGTITRGDNLTFDGVKGEFSIDKITKNNKSVNSASYGEKADLTISADSGDISQITNKTVGARLAYPPKTANVYTTFTSQITFDLSSFSGSMNNGRNVYLDLYNIGTGMMAYNLVLPDGVMLAKDGESYILTVTLPSNISRALWAGMEFTYKIYDDSTSSYIVVATGIVLSVIA